MGWNDAASAATTALEAVAVSLDSEVIARIDPEEFFDFQDNRPTVRLTAGQTRRIEWPANTLIAAPAPTAERDMILLSGTEPSLKWRTFTELVVGAAERLGAEMVITLGALIADVPHTRPVPITGLATDRELVERLGLSRSKYEGPTGIVGVLHDACRRHGLTSASLWAAVPHYVAAVPNPKASSRRPRSGSTSRSTARSPPIQRSRSWSSASSRSRPSRSSSRTTSRRARRSRASFNASCASAASTETAASPATDPAED
jgi:PAC2 family